MGACAACFVSPRLFVSEAFQNTVFAESGASTIDPAAKLLSLQITNEP